jgi:benzoyl-CoA reductase/2-hydroxyglutaryl-CoA dehydratase subunit BcrC/BadD/HgdB
LWGDAPGGHMFVNNPAGPLIDDEYTGESASKRLLAHLLARRERGAKFVGVYCAYAPTELIRAFDLVSVSLCAFSNATI